MATVYERVEDGVSILWDTRDDMPDIPRDDFERRCAALPTLVGEQDAMDMRERFQDSDHDGPTANPYDASQLAIWETWVSNRPERGWPGRTVGLWVSPDGLANMTLTDDDDTPLAALADVARDEDQPVLRVWSLPEPGALPYRMRLLRV